MNHAHAQRDAAAVLATLALFGKNRSTLVQAGCLRPLVALCQSPDLRVRRDAWGALASLTAREDICEQAAAATPR